MVVTWLRIVYYNINITKQVSCFDFVAHARSIIDPLYSYVIDIQRQGPQQIKSRKTTSHQYLFPSVQTKYGNKMLLIVLTLTLKYSQEW